MIEKKRLMPLDLLSIVLLIILILIILAALFYPMGFRTSEGYQYEGVDCYLRFDTTRSLTNITEILDRQDLSYKEWYNRASPENRDEIIDYIYFTYNHSTQRIIVGYIYNFNTDNISIKLHYYPDEIISYTDKTADEVRNLTYSTYLNDKNRFENDVEYIVQIFEDEFNVTVTSKVCVQLIEHFSIM